MSERIPIEIGEGLYVLFDAAQPAGRTNVGFVDSGALSSDEPTRLVHVMSPHAGGEIRGYVFARGTLRLRWPCYTGSWPEMEDAVSRALRLPVMPYAVEPGGHVRAQFAAGAAAARGQLELGVA